MCKQWCQFLIFYHSTKNIEKSSLVQLSIFTVLFLRHLFIFFSSLVSFKSLLTRFHQYRPISLFPFLAQPSCCFSLPNYGKSLSLALVYDRSRRTPKKIIPMLRCWCHIFHYFNQSARAREKERRESGEIGIILDFSRRSRVERAAATLDSCVSTLLGCHHSKSLENDHHLRLQMKGCDSLQFTYWPSNSGWLKQFSVCDTSFRLVRQNIASRRKMLMLSCSRPDHPFRCHHQQHWNWHWKQQHKLQLQ